MLIQLVHQAGEELVGILLLSYIQLLVPHLKNLIRCIRHVITGTTIFKTISFLEPYVSISC